MPLILKVHSMPVYRNKANSFRTVPHFSVGLNIIHHKFRDDIINNTGFCEALKVGNVEIIEDTDRIATVKEVLGAILNIDKKSISMTDQISDIMWPSNKKVTDLYHDFDFQIETAFNISYGARVSMAVKAMTVRELHQLIEERSNQSLEVGEDE